MKKLPERLKDVIGKSYIDIVLKEINYLHVYGKWGTYCHQDVQFEWEDALRKVSGLNFSNTKDLVFFVISWYKKLYVVEIEHIENNSILHECKIIKSIELLDTTTLKKFIDTLNQTILHNDKLIYCNRRGCGKKELTKYNSMEILYKPHFLKNN